MSTFFKCSHENFSTKRIVGIVFKNCFILQWYVVLASDRDAKGMLDIRDM